MSEEYEMGLRDDGLRCSGNGTCIAYDRLSYPSELVEREPLLETPAVWAGLG